MIYGVVMAIHVVVALFLIGVILIQGGRGGLGEALGGSGASSLFGGGANIVMTKVTAAAATMFMITCLSLAALSTARGKSVIDQIPLTQGGLPLGLPGVTETPPVTPTSVGEEETAPAVNVPAEPAADPSGSPDTAPSEPAPAEATP